MWLTRRLVPGHKTIWEFRNNHRKALAADPITPPRVAASKLPVSASYLRLQNRPDAWLVTATDRFSFEFSAVALSPGHDTPRSGPIISPFLGVHETEARPHGRHIARSGKCLLFSAGLHQAVTGHRLVSETCRDGGTRRRWRGFGGMISWSTWPPFCISTGGNVR